MSQEPMYIVRDSAGATYGPANIATLQQWIGEGRITSQMQIAPEGTQTFTSANDIPELASAFSSQSTLAPTPASTPAAAYTQTTAAAVTYSAIPRSSGMAVTALVCGIAAWPFACTPLAIVAIITGHIARGQIRREPERFEGQGMATAGLVMGYIQLFLTLAVVVVYVLFIVLFAAAAVHSSY